ncbi:DEAD/DEAH box helicase [Proteiniclasticum sp. C24MP]|uniref:DEAD/DEAH box helicase n=1 Tax=Proteiniclasticum sp. C24MP TaxID=3374101 RepID=UPI0037549E11
MLFTEMNLTLPIQKALKDEGYSEATPIQEKSIPKLLEGRDLLGCAQTGTGKTAAFALPILEDLSKNQTFNGKRKIKTLVLAPTRELAIQIGESFKSYSKYLNLKTTVIFGGVSQNPQTAILTKGIDILVATPGRLLDLIQQKFINLSQVEHFVLDEADMMLDMGMLHDVKKIISYLPQKRQTLFFSATMPKEIEVLANTILHRPEKVTITPVASTVDTIKQSVYHVNKKNKIHLLTDLLESIDMDRVLVFSRTKHGADKIVKALEKKKFKAQAIHGNKSQNARQLALKNFKDRETRILVATDIAARGIDVEELSHVIIFDLPEVAETYVHRIGRTGRAGLGGVALSFCDTSEQHLLRDIEKLIEKKIGVVAEHSYPLMDLPEEEIKEKRYVPANKSSNSRGGSGKNYNAKNSSRRDSSRGQKNQYAKKNKAV